MATREMIDGLIKFIPIIIFGLGGFLLKLGIDSFTTSIACTFLFLIYLIFLITRWLHERISKLE